jgi:hypothetical protein
MRFLVRKIAHTPQCLISTSQLQECSSYLTTSNKATGPDSIPGKFLRDLGQEITPALTLIFNASLHQGRVPSQWGKAAVVPLFKKGDKGKASNYRPVSLTSITCKIMEHTMHSNIIRHLEISNILSDHMALEKKHPVKANLSSPFRTWPMDSTAGTNLTVSFLTFQRHLIKFYIEDSSTNASTMESEETPCSRLRASCKDAHSR